MVTKIRSRDALLAELTSVFVNRGYEGATLAALARASGLGKASLYHHFPGGKEEMVAVLLRDAVARLEHMAFRGLTDNRPADERLVRFVDGFVRYTQAGQRQCLLAILAQGSIGERHGEQIAQQYRVWEQTLAAVFEETGQKPKRALRSAQALLADLYGYLLTARILKSPAHFTSGMKRLKKSLA